MSYSCVSGYMHVQKYAAGTVPANMEYATGTSKNVAISWEKIYDNRCGRLCLKVRIQGLSEQSEESESVRSGKMFSFTPFYSYSFGPRRLNIKQKNVT